MFCNWLQLVAFSACNLSPNVLSSYCCASIICAKQCTVHSYENTTEPLMVIFKKKKKTFSHCSQYHTMLQCDCSLGLKEMKSSTYWRFLLKFLAQYLWDMLCLSTVLSVVIKGHYLCAVSKPLLGGQLSASWLDFYNPSVLCFLLGKPHMFHSSANTNTHLIIIFLTT